jgi:hypothetical protein
MTGARDLVTQAKSLVNYFGQRSRPTRVLLNDDSPVDRPCDSGHGALTNQRAR